MCAALGVVQGALVKCEVDGSLTMTSYLTGGPEIRVGLNQELVIGRQENPGGTASFASGGALDGRCQHH